MREEKTIRYVNGVIDNLLGILGVKNLDDAIKRRKPLIIGATAPTSSTTTWARVFKEILEWKTDFVLFSNRPIAGHV